jgi:hypothetical protein
MAPNKEASTGLACSKKFAKADFSVQCTVCGLWIHKSCGNISDEGFKYLDEQFKNTGTAYWACRACTQYAKMMNHKMREIENELGRVKEACQSNTNDIKKVQDDVTKLAAIVEQQTKKVDEATAAAAKTGSAGIFDEIRERESKRNNVIMHGMVEAPQDHIGRARWDWDMKSCANLFQALRLNTKPQDIRFVRRVGELGDRPRPLVVVFHEEREKNRVLRADTRRSQFSDVDIVPDLTRAQRREEDDMRKEMVSRNRRMSSEDRAKNLVWSVVGPRGAKRLVKKFTDLEEERAGNRRPGRQQAGSTVRDQPCVNGPRQRLAQELPPRDAREEMDVTVDIEAAHEETQGVSAAVTATRARLGSKRGRGGSTEVEEPPAKH